jgi:hypothetical protein
MNTSRNLYLEQLQLDYSLNLQNFKNTLDTIIHDKQSEFEKLVQEQHISSQQIINDTKNKLNKPFLIDKQTLETKFTEDLQTIQTKMITQINSIKF